MKVLFYILLSLAIVFLLCIVGVFAYTFYRLATGKVSEDEYEHHLREHEKTKQKRKTNRHKSSGLSSNSLPGPIRRTLGSPF